MTLYAGIDLHSTNSVLAIIDQDGKRLHRRRYGNDIELILVQFGADPRKRSAR